MDREGVYRTSAVQQSGRNKLIHYENHNLLLYLTDASLNNRLITFTGLYSFHARVLIVSLTKHHTNSEYFEFKGETQKKKKDSASLNTNRVQKISKINIVFHIAHVLTTK